MSEIASTGRRRELGAELRRVREERGYKAYDMATRLGWTASTVSRAENGKRTVTQVEVATYLAMCGVAGDELDEVLELVTEPDTYRLKPHGDDLPDALRTLIFHETTATAIESFQPIYVPGLAQTADYARALFQESDLEDKSKIEDCVRMRMNRRALLNGWNPPLCSFYVHENALRAPIGGPRVMSEQLLHLLFLGTRPKCSIQVVPVSAGARGMSAGTFQIFGYPDDPSVVCVQHETTSEFLEDRDEVASFRRILKRVASVALDDAQSRKFLAMVASDYERQEEAGYEGGAREAERLAQEQL